MLIICGAPAACGRRSLHAVLSRVRCVWLQEVQDSGFAERAPMLASRCTSCRGCRGEMVREGGQGVAGVGAVALLTQRNGFENFIHLGVAFGSTIWAPVCAWWPFSLRRLCTIGCVGSCEFCAAGGAARRARGDSGCTPSGRRVSRRLYHAEPFLVFAQLRVCVVAAVAGYLCLVFRSIS